MRECKLQSRLLIRWNHCYHAMLHRWRGIFLWKKSLIWPDWTPTGGVISSAGKVSTSPVKPFFEFHIHSDNHVSNIKVNTVVFFLSQNCFSYHFFHTPKSAHLSLSPPPLRPHWLTLPLLPCPHVRSHWLSPRLSYPGLGIVKTSATSQWALHSDNNDMSHDSSDKQTHSMLAN